MPLVMAFGLPQSPVLAVAFILAVLAFTYALLTTIIKTQSPSAFVEPTDEEDSAPASVGETDAYEIPAPPAFPSAVQDAPAEASAQSENPLCVDAVTIRGCRVAIGDAAAVVMRAVRRNESAGIPRITKDAAGRATEVERHYRVNRVALTLVLHREEPDGPLRLARIDLNT